MKKVVTTEQSQVLGVVIKELGRIAPAGILFECTDARFEVLAGKNGYHAVFVREAGKVEESKPVAEEKVEVAEPAVEAIVEEAPKDEDIEVVETEEAIPESSDDEEAPKKKKKK